MGARGEVTTADVCPADLHAVAPSHLPSLSLPPTYLPSPSLPQLPQHPEKYTLTNDGGDVLTSRKNNHHLLLRLIHRTTLSLPPTTTHVATALDDLSLPPSTTPSLSLLTTRRRCHLPRPVVPVAAADDDLSPC